MIAHGRKQISEMVYARKASEGGGAVRLTNMIRGGAVVFGGLEPFVKNMLTSATRAAILAAFGQTDGKAVIKATNRYLNQLAASDRDKATALAGFINEDPMMVCSLGLEVQGVTMPIRYCVTDGVAYIDTGIVGTQNTHLRCKTILLEDTTVTVAIFGADINYVSRNFTAWLHWSTYDSVGFGGQQKNGSRTPLNVPFELDANKTHWTNTKLDGTPIWDITFNTPSAFTTPSTMALFTYRRNGVPSVDTKRHGHAECEIEDGNTHKFFIPFIRNNVNGMLDLVGGTFYANAAASGTFTEAFYLPDGTPWTPSTP